MKKIKPFLFIGDILNIDKNSINLFDDYYLHKATSSQQKIIKKYVEGYLKSMPIFPNPYESIISEVKDNKWTTTLSNSKEDFKYFVIDHYQNYAKLEMQLILAISKLDLTILFESINGGIMQNQLRSLNYFHDSHFFSFPPETAKRVKDESIAELKKINNLLKNFNPNEFPFIQKALKDLVNIKDISSRSPFKILSYFSILELLLTSYRTKTLNDNSISTQLKKKLNLLNNQFFERIAPSEYFKGSDTNTIETIIEKLYQYRNDIAHGNLIDFERDLRILKDQQKNILPFLKKLTRETLLVALEYPTLISDLKEC